MSTLATRRTTPERKRYHAIHTVEDLARHLQWALSVELSTIPPYLCALYSIVDRSTPAYALIRSVALEEMLHMTLVMNLLNAIGTPPSLGPEAVPAYPGYIPHHAAGGPLIQLQALSADLARTVFMAIEKPESSHHLPPEGDYFQTIGQFYHAIEVGFESCVAEYGEEEVFGHDTGFQRADTHFGSGGGHLIVVHDLHSARDALTEITEQGEGALHPQPPLPYEEPFGGYEFYGQRLDGTYGPILGMPWELSHYRKFQQIADAEVACPPTYPMLPNPSSDQYSGQTRALAELFDASFTLVLRAVARAFSSTDATGAFFGVAFPLMRSALPPLATLLLQTPLQPGADPSLGPVAGPGFAYAPRPLAEMLRQTDDLLAHPPDLGAAYQQIWQQTLADVATTLRSARDTEQQLGGGAL